MVSFSHTFVKELQDDQTDRYKKNIKKKPKEFRSSSETQVEGMLATKSDYSCEKDLHKKLVRYTDQLKQHCGASFSSVASNKELSTMEKLKKLAKLVTHSSEEDVGVGVVGGGPFHEGRVISLQTIITDTMIQWAGKEIQSLKLIEEVFSLLFRQFNEVGEVAQALEKTYVLEVTRCPKSGKQNFDIPGFCSALGSLRLLLKVGMSKKEENLLKSSLRLAKKLFLSMYSFVNNLASFLLILWKKIWKCIM